MTLTVVILNYNVRYFLELCVHSVVKATQNLQAEIIVVDNNSSDESELVKQLFPQIKWIQTGYNSGFPKGNNIGVEAATGKYLCILNPDTLVPEDFFSSFLAFAERHPNFGIVGPHLIDGAGAYLPESKRGVPTPFVATAKILNLHRLFPNISFFNSYYAGHLKRTDVAEVPILVGACMFMETEFYRQLNGFDEACFMYADDIDLSYRSLLANRKNYYLGTLVGLHFKGESTDRNIQYINRFREAMLFFYRKHFKPNFLFNNGLRLGAWIFANFKSRQQTRTQLDPTAIFWIGSNELRFTEFSSILEKFAVRVRKIEPNAVHSQTFSENEQNLIIFDCKNVSYQQILEIMQEKAHPKVGFRFALANSKVIVGSDSSNSKGVVLF